MVIDDADAVGDLRGDGVPAEVRRIFGVEVVLDIRTGTAGVLDDVLVAPADYGKPSPSVVANEAGNVFGTQFPPRSPAMSD